MTSRKPRKMDNFQENYRHAIFEPTYFNKTILWVDMHHNYYYQTPEGDYIDTVFLQKATPDKFRSKVTPLGTFKTQRQQQKLQLKDSQYSTPYQGEWRCYGLFHCTICKKEWGSA